MFMLQFAGVVLAVVAAIGYFEYRTWGMGRLKITTGKNTNSLASRVFLSLLGRAKEEMLLCDDGNKMPDSLYEDVDIINAVRKKLEGNPNFHIKCLFSDDERTAFRDALEAHPRVSVKIVARRRPIHYKIIDGGESGYLTKHRRGQRRRSYKLFEHAHGWVRQDVLGPHIADINQEFEHAA